MKFKSLARLTGQVIINLICYIDMPLIVLGGIPEMVEDDFKSELLAEVKKHAAFDRLEDLEIRFAGSKNEEEEAKAFVCLAADRLFC